MKKGKEHIWKLCLLQAANIFFIVIIQCAFPFYINLTWLCLRFI